jgi:hypothetical protein
MDNRIACPHCGESIDIEHVIHDNLKKQYADKESVLKQQVNAKRIELEKQQQELVAKTELIDQQIRDGVKASLSKERETLTKQIRLDIQTEQSDQISSLTEQLKEQSAKVKELYAAQVTIEQLKREKDELGDKLKAEA